MKKILIVEDDKDILDAIQIILEREQFAVATTSKGEETYRKVNSFQPDLIILDVLISGNDGRTICKKLKSGKSTKGIPVIMMSAHPSAMKDYKEYGGDDFLAKPFETSELLEIVGKYI